MYRFRRQFSSGKVRIGDNTKVLGRSRCTRGQREIYTLHCLRQRWESPLLILLKWPCVLESISTHCYIHLGCRWMDGWWDYLAGRHQFLDIWSYLSSHSWASWLFYEYTYSKHNCLLLTIELLLLNLGSRILTVDLSHRMNSFRDGVRVA